MLKSFDYLDPSIASKIRTLEQELDRIKESKQKIVDDPGIRAATKSKLISYQDDCYDHTSKMLNDERDKLTDYLDEQTNVITKENRSTHLRHSHKPSLTLNQSTRIDLSTDDARSFEGTSHTEQYKKITSFYIEEGRRQKEK